MAAERKVSIKNVDMSEQLQQESIEVAQQAMDKHNLERDIANFIKKEFDKRHGTFWHVVVGKNYGSFVTHETKMFIYFHIGPLAILMFKAG
mmetsp:Transcript_10184/g.30219  ORF Transcript_10184/g.30219 Transcript_10184/m.30219 type:complete len:91 (-) Transcript_10184:226-498(-)